MSILATEIKQEHHQAELLRLRQGEDGCGCDLCQQLYSTLDLEKFGGRVIRTGGIVSIQAGRTGADLWERYNKPDYWTADGQIFVHNGEGFAVGPNLESINLGPVDADGHPLEPSPDGGEALLDGREVVPKIGGVVNHVERIMAQVFTDHKGRGRPKKQDGEPVYRRTYYRRKAETQGVMAL